MLDIRKCSWVWAVVCGVSWSAQALASDYTPTPVVETIAEHDLIVVARVIQEPPQYRVRRDDDSVTDAQASAEDAIRKIRADL